MNDIREAYAYAARNGLIRTVDISEKMATKEETRKPTTPAPESAGRGPASMPSKAAQNTTPNLHGGQHAAGPVGLVARPSHWATRGSILPPVKGHSVRSNKQAADLFKALLEDEAIVSSPDKSPSPQATEKEAVPSTSPPYDYLSIFPPLPAPRAFNASKAAVEDAFWPAGVGSLKRSSSERDDAHQVEAKAKDLSHLLHGGQEVTDAKTTSDEARLKAQTALHAKLSGQSVAEALAAGTVKLKKRKKLSGAPVPLVLPGLGEGRTRNEYGKSLSGVSMETGVGVIGEPMSIHRATPVPEAAARQEEAPPAEQAPPPSATDMGPSCDLPMAQGRRSSNRIISLGGDGTRYQVGNHIIDLSPDLPALAAEHPARVWNQMLHSLSPKLQPIIKWDYQPCEPEGLQIACLTLVLPPSHPAIAHHPLFSILPANRYTREYMASVEALGGIKQWIGEPRKYKADAQNTTLVRCMAEDALAWLLDPVLEVLPDEEEEGSEELTSGSNVEHAGIDNAPPYDITSALKPAMQAISTQACSVDPLNELETASQSPDWGVQGTSRAWTQESSSSQFKVLTEPQASQEANAGNHQDRMSFQPSKTISSPQPPLQVSIVTLEPSVSAATDVLPDQKLSAAKAYEDVDWQGQLRHFCEVSGLPYPKYGQQVQKKPGSTTFLGTLDLEDEHFVSTVARPLLKAARQDVARLVFVDHFGQEPSTLV